MTCPACRVRPHPPSDPQARRTTLHRGATSLPDTAYGALVPLGWNGRVAALFETIAQPGLVPARVVRVERSSCRIATAQGEHRAHTPNLPAVGDWVAASVTDDGTTVVAIVPAWSQLVRTDPKGQSQVLAANVDVVFITAPADRLNKSRVERETSMAWDSGAEPVVLVTKADVATPDQAEQLRRRLVNVAVIATSALSGEGLDEIAALLQPSRTAVLLGPSGAGKSSLANALVGQQRLATTEVRAGDHRGRHTTTYRQLLVVPGGGVLIDTPGLRSLSLTGHEAGIAATFDDIEEFAATCRFRDCRHLSEPDCAVTAALASGRLDPERMANYRKLHDEMVVAAGGGNSLARPKPPGRPTPPPPIKVWAGRRRSARNAPKKKH